MARDNFASALPEVLSHEGGWADHPRDPGGATQKGVTLATYRRYRPGATKEQLRNISDAELQRIYRDGYWDKVRGDDLPSGLDFAVFDFAVNSGPGRAAKYLQALVGVAQDGAIGPKTLAAVAAYDPAKLIDRLCDRRMSFLRNLSHWGTFGKGWTRRVEGVRTVAKEMAARGPKPAPAPIPPERPSKPPSGSSVAIIALLTAIAAAVAFFLFGR